MTIKRWINIAILLFVPIVAAAQGTISGTVLDNDGYPLPGAAVIVSGTKTGTATDLDGKFTISVEAGKTLEVSALGFATQTIKVGNQTDYKVTLQPDELLLSEVVVVGYDTQKKVNLTGSVGSLSSESFQNVPIPQASTALQGTVSGVTVTSQGGAPGSDGGTIRIRGLGTFGNSSAAPLVLIDGVEGDIDAVDAAQIDQISILKDAASSSIYGSRAANGVILVTTKRADKDKFSFTYNGYAGWQEAVCLPSLVDAKEYMTLSREATENDGGTSIYTDSYIDNYITNNFLDPDNYPITNWQEELLTGDGFTTKHNLSLNASSGKMKSLTSFGYLYQNGIISNTDYNRYNLRNNLDIAISEKLTFRLDISASYGLAKGIPSQSSVFTFMNARDPLMLAKWSDGSYAPFTGGSLNILPYTAGLAGNTKKYRVNANLAASLTYKPFKWWTIEGKISPRIVYNKNHTFVNKVQYHSDPYGTISSVSNVQHNYLSESQSTYYYSNYLLTTSFQHSFAGGHYLKLLLGASNEGMNQTTMSGYRQDYEYPDYEVLSAGAADETMSNGGEQYRWRLISGFARLNWNYKERYLIEANFRADGSSRFAEGKRWGFFPSVSAAWRMSEEVWMQESKNTLTEMKIRASWGRLGNQNIGSDYYPTIQSLTVSNMSANDILYPILATTALANQDIS